MKNSDARPMNLQDIEQEIQKKQRAADLLPNRWIIAVGAGLFLGLKTTGFGFEMNPIKFYQLFLEIVKYVCLSLVVVSIWMTMFRFFVGRFKGELLWFTILMIFLFSTEAFANIFLQISRKLIDQEQHRIDLLMDNKKPQVDPSLNDHSETQALD